MGMKRDDDGGKNPVSDERVTVMWMRPGSSEAMATQAAQFVCSNSLNKKKQPAQTCRIITQLSISSVKAPIYLYILHISKPSDIIIGLQLTIIFIVD